MSERVLTSTTRYLLLALLVLTGVRPAAIIHAQASDTVGTSSFVAYVDGQQVNWQRSGTFPADSVATAQAVMDRLRREGHLLARLDSVLGSPPRVFISSGPEFTIGEITFSGDPAFRATEMLGLMESGTGRPFNQNVLEDDIRFLLTMHNRQGWPLSEARIASVRPAARGSEALDIDIRVDRGPAVVLSGLELPGSERTRSRYVQRLTGLRVGKRIEGFNPSEVRRKILATSHFREVGEPRLELRPDGNAVVVIPVQEEAPGNFDLVLGYVPETSTASRGGLVGNGFLELRNLFGGGRIFNLRLNRLPGQVSSLDAGVSDPNVAGFPLGLEGSFHGVQQDSTYDQQRYSAAISYEISDGLRIVGSASREVTKPGQAGLQILSRRQRIPRSAAAFFGLGVRYESVDWPVNPRRGLQVESMFERGNKNRTARIVEASGDTLTSRKRLNQERLALRVRYFQPTFPRQLVVIGTDVRLVLSNDYDESDLIRFGGARSLRGYNEEQFLGRLAGRLLIEYRYQLDRYAFAYLFTDLGVLETASTEGDRGRREVLPGFGVGTQFRTEIGVINVSYAVNDKDSPIDGRIHVGLSFSL